MGGEYDPETLRFDHHQRGFFETMDGEKGVATKAEEATGEFKTKVRQKESTLKKYGL